MFSPWCHALNMRKWRTSGGRVERKIPWNTGRERRPSFGQWPRKQGGKYPPPLPGKWLSSPVGWPLTHDSSLGLLPPWVTTQAFNTDSWLSTLPLVRLMTHQETTGCARALPASWCRSPSCRTASSTQWSPQSYRSPWTSWLRSRWGRTGGWVE